MSTESTCDMQVECLHSPNNINDLGDGSWAIEDAPAVDAWRVSSTHVAYRCPYCLGLHFQNVGRGSQMVTRRPSCPPEFVFDDTGPINMAIQPGPAPRGWQWVFDKSPPRGDLALAYRIIAVDGAAVADGWMPSSENIEFALRTLAECGAGAEARVFRRELAHLSGRIASSGVGGCDQHLDGCRSFRHRLGQRLRQRWMDLAL